MQVSLKALKTINQTKLNFKKKFIKRKIAFRCIFIKLIKSSKFSVRGGRQEI